RRDRRECELIQTWAIFVDAYRELNSKRMFWVTLVLSGLVVAAFATVGLTERGYSVLGWENVSWFNSKVVSRPMFYHWIFGEFGVKRWLAFVATTLALISTAGMVPDLITGGAIDLYVSKPIGRLRLFLTKFAAGLLFAALQVTFF